MNSRHPATLAVTLAAVAAGLGIGLAINSEAPPTRTVTHALAAPSGCHPRTPPSAGECVAKHFGFAHAARLTATRAPCADYSQWQGSYPNFAGLKCVILQANYGGHVEPSIFEQMRDAREHGVRFGCYTFGLSSSGIEAARLANRVCSLRAGRKLGLWYDAEISGAYEHACSYISEAKALGAHIAGLYSAPGLWPGGRCGGLLWPAEWGVVSAYPFGGYPRSAIVLLQDCGTCFRFGHEQDLDVSLGLVELGKPAVTHRVLEDRLHATERTRARLHGLIERYRCRPGEHNLPREPERARLRMHRRCGEWLHEGQVAVATEVLIRRQLEHS